MMDSFLESYGGVLTLAALGAGAAALVLSLVLVADLRRLKRPFRGMAAVCEKKGPEQALEELLKGIDENREFLRVHSDEIKRIHRLLAADFAGVGLVKYNAFEDIGGMQSYSLCLLTREKHGFILTNLVGRTATRGYALDIKDGKPSRNLSDEEKEAYDIALKSLAPPAAQ